MIFGRILGIFLLALPFLSFEEWIPSLNYNKYLNTPSIWASGLAIVAGIGSIASYFFGRPLDRILDRISALLSDKAGYVFLIIPLLLTLVSLLVFNAKPHIVDAIVQIFQGQVFATGRVMASPLANPEFFMGQHLLYEPNGVFSQYPPGYSLLLAPFCLFNVEFIADILLTSAAAYLIYKSSVKLFGKSAGLISLLLMIFSPHFICTGVSYMNHIPALTGAGIILYALSHIWQGERGSNQGRYFAMLGFALGLIFVCRPLAAIALGFATFLTVISRITARNIFYLGVSGAAVSSLFFIFNWITLDNPLLSGYIKLWGESHGLGFHKDPWGEVHTLQSGIALQIYNLYNLNEYLFESPLPALYLIAIPLLAGIRLAQNEFKLLVIYSSLPVVYVFYWHQDYFLGPRFLYEGLAFLFPLISSLVYRSFIYLREKEFQLNRPFNLGTFWRLTIITALAFSVFSGIPLRLGIYATGMKSMKLDLLQEAKQSGINRGIVFVSTSWGDRMVSLLRGWGIGASLAEESYRKVDNCEIWELMQDFREHRVDFNGLQNGLLEKIAKNEVLARPDWNKDPTLKVDPTRQFSQACLNEIEYDLKDNGGYTIYSPHILSNKGSWDNNLIFARDLRDLNEVLIRQHPDREAYFYRAGRFLPIK